MIGTKLASDIPNIWWFYLPVPHKWFVVCLKVSEEFSLIYLALLLTELSQFWHFLDVAFLQLTPEAILPYGINWFSQYSSENCVFRLPNAKKFVLERIHSYLVGCFSLLTETSALVIYMLYTASEKTVARKTYRECGCVPFGEANKRVFEGKHQWNWKGMRKVWKSLL